MRPFVLLLCLLPYLSLAQPSYWFQQFQRKQDAQLAQEFFFVPGVGVTFTYATNRVIINAVGGGGGALQLNGDVTSPLSALPNVTTTLKNTGTAGTYTKVTFNAKGLETSGTAAVLASADFATQGGVNEVLHGGGGGNPSWAAVGNSDLANSSVTYNGKTVALGGSATLTLASSDFQNQGTSPNVVLHGNNAGDPTWSLVSLANDVTGNLGVTHLAGGVGAGVGTFWRGDGSWAAVTAGPDTPWTVDHNGAGFMLTNAINLSCSNVIGGNIMFISNTAYIREIRSSTDTSPFFKLLNNGKFNFAASLNNVGQLGALQLDFPNGGSDTALFMGGNIAAQPFGKTLLQQGGQYLWSTSLQGISPIPAITIHGTPTFVGTRPYSIYIGTTVVGSGDTELVVDQVGQTNLFLHGVLARQGFFTTPTNNGIGGALYKSSPLHAWANMSGFGNGGSGNATFVSPTVVAGTYYPITNYNYCVTNHWGCTLTATNGVMTNKYAGWYRVAFSVSGFGSTGNELEVDVSTNNVLTDVVAAHGTTSTGNKSTSMSATGRLWLDVGTSVQLFMRNIDSTSLTITHVQLDVGP